MKKILTAIALSNILMGCGGSADGPLTDDLGGMGGLGGTGTAHEWPALSVESGGEDGLNCFFMFSQGEPFEFSQHRLTGEYEERYFALGSRGLSDWNGEGFSVTFFGDEGDGQCVAPCTIKSDVLHCEYRQDVHVCQGAPGTPFFDCD